MLVCGLKDRSKEPKRDEHSRSRWLAGREVERHIRVLVGIVEEDHIEAGGTVLESIGVVGKGDRSHRVAAALEDVDMGSELLELADMEDSDTPVESDRRDCTVAGHTAVGHTVVADCMEVEGYQRDREEFGDIPDPVGSFGRVDGQPCCRSRSME